MINVKQAFTPPLRAAHCVTAPVLQRPCRTLAQDQQLELRTAPDTLISLPARRGVTACSYHAPSPFISGELCSPCACLMCVMAGSSAASSFPRRRCLRRRESAGRGADGTAGTCHAEMSLRSPRSRRRQQGFLHRLYARWQHITLLCCWAGVKVANTSNTQPSAKFSQHGKEKTASDVESLRVRILPTPQAHLFSLKGAFPFQRAMKTLQ